MAQTAVHAVSYFHLNQRLLLVCVLSDTWFHCWLLAVWRIKCTCPRESQHRSKGFLLYLFLKTVLHVINFQFVCFWKLMLCPCWADSSEFCDSNRQRWAILKYTFILILSTPFFSATYSSGNSSHGSLTIFLSLSLSLLLPSCLFLTLFFLSLFPSTGFCLMTQTPLCQIT